MKQIELENIRVDQGTQSRSRINPDVVAEYAEQMNEGAKFPALTVFQCNGDFILADGFHRFEAYQQTGAKTVACDVEKGSREDALKFSLGANSTHGLRRTNADKRAAATLALKEWPKKSDRWLAEICGVSHNFIREMRDSIPSASESVRETKSGAKRVVPEKKVEEEETTFEERPHVTAGITVDDSVHIIDGMEHSSAAWVAGYVEKQQQQQTWVGEGQVTPLTQCIRCCRRLADTLRKHEEQPLEEFDMLEAAVELEITARTLRKLAAEEK